MRTNLLRSATKSLALRSGFRCGETMRANLVRASSEAAPLRRGRPPTAKPSLCSEAAPPRRSRPSTAKPSGFGSGARTSYIGREHDKETDLGFGACPEALRGSVRLYEPEYGRFLSTDVLWSKYLPLQPFQYAGNNPVMALDDNGKEIVGIRETDRDYLKSSMCSHFGVDVSFTDQGAMKISSGQLAEASSRIDALSYGQLLGINEMANDNSKVLSVVALPGEEHRRDGITLTAIDNDGKVVGAVYGEFATSVRESEKFVSHPDAPKSAFILIRPAITETETFKAAGGGQTKPCGTCVLIHALLDHAMPWFKLGVSATRKEGVANHNVGLVTKANSQIRDGSDHTNVGVKNR